MARMDDWLSAIDSALSTMQGIAAAKRTTEMQEAELKGTRDKELWLTAGEMALKEMAAQQGMGQAEVDFKMARALEDYRELRATREAEAEHERELDILGREQAGARKLEAMKQVGALEKAGVKGVAKEPKTIQQEAAEILIGAYGKGVGKQMEARELQMAAGMEVTPESLFIEEKTKSIQQILGKMMPVPPDTSAIDTLDTPGVTKDDITDPQKMMDRVAAVLDKTDIDPDDYWSLVESGDDEKMRQLILEKGGSMNDARELMAFGEAIRKTLSESE